MSYIKTHWKIAVIFLAVVVSLLIIIMIYVTPLDYSIKVAALGIIMTILSGNLAAILVGRILQEKDTKKARIATLQSLKIEVARIRDLTQDYLSGNAKSGAPTLDTTAFETTLVSGSLGPATMEAVKEYLVLADKINSIAATYLTVTSDKRNNVLSDIKGECKPLLGILDKLDKSLSQEIEAS